MTQPPLVALTGGTGFVGRHVAAAFTAAGWRLRLLVRRDPIHPLLADAELDLVLGGIDDAAALARLVRGADAVVHLAGLTKARDAAAFMAVNRDGSARLAEAAARQVPGARCILVSSLAARVPGLSPYAASKHAGEAAVLAASPGWTLLRPAVVYGPGDLEGLALQRLSRAALAPRPTAPELRLAMLHASDLAAAILALVPAAPGGCFEVCDACPAGYGFMDILALAARLQGRMPPCGLALPDGLLLAAGAATDLFSRLSRHPRIAGLGKMREILHRDWRCDPALLIPPALWVPGISLERGMAETALWWAQRQSQG